MFLCKECHGPNVPYRFGCDPGFPMNESYGSCERCKKSGGCIDCHSAYHGKIPAEAVEQVPEPAELDCAA